MNPDQEATIERLKAEKAELFMALSRAFMTLGRFGGNHVSELEAQTVRSLEVRQAWLDAREALAKVVS